MHQRKRIHNIWSIIILGILCTNCVACQPARVFLDGLVSKPAALIATIDALTRVPTSTPLLLTTLTPSPTPGLPLPKLPESPGTNGHPSLANFWESGLEARKQESKGTEEPGSGGAEGQGDDQGRGDPGRVAIFTVDVEDTGLPMGESDTLVMQNGELWSYLHASDRSAGVTDPCGNPVEFPGCTVIYRSTDGGVSFHLPSPAVCQFPCATCPCDSEEDHIDQQQYPRLTYNGQTLFLAYEYRGRVRLRRSPDGVSWSYPEEVAGSGIWKLWLHNCSQEERIGPHPFVPYDYECLAGGPPGLYTEEETLYIFVAMGQNPGSMGCYRGSTVSTTAELFTRCQNNPLFTGATDYGPLEEKGTAANAHFDFRTTSSAEVQKIGDRYYMLYEGVRGPGPGDPGDTQFGLGLARSLTSEIDGPWETYPYNPILIDLPGNIGLGHADLVVIDGQTFLYTSLDGIKRSRLVLHWK
ncbi:MAG: hypothetical protein JXA33_11620 [Anaerolineae bacterium]|nr:hypothetical protein [Anaerolineae bacterium]